MEAQIKQEGQYQYVEQGEGPVLLLLHGLFGALSNFETVFQYFSENYKVVIPLLPIYQLPLNNCGVEQLAEFTQAFMQYKSFGKATLIGNSLGGHIALLNAIHHPQTVESLVLTGSSGLFENALGDTYPRRHDYEYVKKKTAETFFDPSLADKALVDEVFDAVNDREKALRIIKLARSAIRQNVGEHLPNIKIPTLLVWGNNDVITPPFVGTDFHEALPQSELHFIDQCGHVPMMEHPQKFNVLLHAFLKKIENS